MKNYDDILADSATTAVVTATHDHLDALLGGLALLEAHTARDADAVQALLAGQTPGSALHSVLTASELLVEALGSTSPHRGDDVVAAVRREALRHQSTHGPDGACPGA